MEIEKWSSKLALISDSETFFNYLLDERYKNKKEELIENFRKKLKQYKKEK